MLQLRVHHLSVLLRLSRRLMERPQAQVALRLRVPSEAGRLDLLRLIELVPTATLSSGLLLASGMLLELAGAVGEVVTTVLATGCRVQLLVVFDTLVYRLVLASTKLPSAFLRLPLVPLAFLLLVLGSSRIGLSVVIVFVVAAACNNIAAGLLS